MPAINPQNCVNDGSNKCTDRVFPTTIHMLHSMLPQGFGRVEDSFATFPFALSLTQPRIALLESLHFSRICNCTKAVWYTIQTIRRTSWSNIICSKSEIFFCVTKESVT